MKSAFASDKNENGKTDIEKNKETYIYESKIPYNEKNKEMVKIAQVVDIEWKRADNRKKARSRKSEVEETNQENSEIIIKSVGKSHGLMEDSILLEL